MNLKDEDIKEGEVIPRSPGRPSVFSQQHLDDLQPLLTKGYSVTRICAEWDISRDTFYRWLRDHDSFKAEYEKHEAKRDAYWEEMGLAGMTGQLPKFNAPAFMFLAQKVTKSLREDPVKTQQTQINIENYNTATQLTDAELAERLAALKEKLPELAPPPPTILEEQDGD